MRLDLNFVRQQFPAFSHPDTARWAHLENAGGSYLPQQVIDRVAQHLAFRVQPYAVAGPASIVGPMMDAGRSAMAELMNVGRDQLVLGPSTTANMDVLARAIPIQPGDEVIVTDQDHEANIGAWRRMAERGAMLRTWEVHPETGILNPDDLARMLNSRTRLVCFTHCSNVVGMINPAAQLIEMIHAAGAQVAIDGVAYAPHALPDLNSLNVDYYGFSLYKTYGPHLGLLYVRRDRLDELIHLGHYFKSETQTASARLDVAGPDHANISGAAGITDYLDEVYHHHFSEQDDAISVYGRAKKVFGLFAEQEERISAQILEFFNARDDVRVIGPLQGDRTVRMPTIAFTTPRPAVEIVAHLAARGVGVRSGHFYARRCIEAVGLAPQDGVVRISALHYNTSEEISRLLEGIAHALR